MTDERYAFVEDVKTVRTWRDLVERKGKVGMGVLFRSII